MQSLAVRAFIVEEQGDDMTGVRRADQRHVVRIEGDNVSRRFAGAIDARGRDGGLGGGHDAGQNETGRGAAEYGPDAEEVGRGGGRNRFGWPERL